jgi:hypothetical protein
MNGRRSLSLACTRPDIGDVHGTKLAPTRFTIATGVERGAAYQTDGADSQLIPGVGLLRHNRKGETFRCR